MRILSAAVDKRPSECSACPICGRVRARAPCGVTKIIKKGHAVQIVKVPDARCLLREAGNESEKIIDNSKERKTKRGVCNR